MKSSDHFDSFTDSIISLIALKKPRYVQLVVCTNTAFHSLLINIQNLTHPQNCVWHKICYFSKNHIAVNNFLSGTFTIFAPTNAAFDALGTEQELLSDKTVLTTILLYHLTNGVIRSTDAKNELTVESVAGLKVRFNIYDHTNVSVICL